MLLRRIVLGERPFDAVAHRSGEIVILEFEDADTSETGSLESLYPQIRAFVDELQAAQTIEALSALAARQVR
ncbi:MAG: hypothetical protein M3145_01070, partial [Pseudomonadota bacterium]|nr:hypothetical protein [Pseudomonadota bacterium]